MSDDEDEIPFENPWRDHAKPDTAQHRPRLRGAFNGKLDLNFNG